MPRKIKTKNVTFDLSAIDDFKKKLRVELVEQTTQQLIEYAKNTLAKAFVESEYANITLNLKDSYVWGVYFDGKRVDYGFLGAKEATTYAIEDGQQIYGREEAQKFIDSYQSRVSRGWELVFAVTTIYGAYLETGTNRTKYVVISSIFDDLQRDFGTLKRIETII